MDAADHNDLGAPAGTIWASISGDGCSGSYYGDPKYRSMIVNGPAGRNCQLSLYSSSGWRSATVDFTIPQS